MKNIYFRKPFIRLIKENEGYVKNAIILFAKEEWKINSRVLNDEERKEKGYTIENTCVQYRYRIRIDLWLVIIDKEWFGKDTSLTPQ